ncbi:DUF2309 domain-containing protein [Halobacteriovorax sp. DPLXC-1]|uniref:DUF2309 domain-containing protein n=1 Tax=Halobacteriovorax sp. DPLXC-1 TaxID=3110771 RepID=UPI002FF41D47
MNEIVKLDKEKIRKEAFTSLKIRQEKSVIETFLEVSKRLTPLWDIRDYVAVNPFFGFKDKNFLELAKYMRHISGKDTLPKKEFFLKKYQSGEITEYDLEVAKKLYLKEIHNNSLSDITIKELMDFIRSSKRKVCDLKFRAVSDFYDLENNEKTTELITKEISRWASAYFDEGQALWKIETKDTRLYTWWKSLVKYDRPFDGKTNRFNEIVELLPESPKKALESLTDILLEKISLEQDDLSNYYYRLIYTTLGWSSYIQKFEFEANRSGESSKLKEIGGLIDIVVMRMAYDIALLDEISVVSLDGQHCSNKDDRDLDLIYIWLNAVECAYRRRVEETIKSSVNSKDLYSRPDVQMAFCIDVRSEVLRRHLENSSHKIQTIGFAGFFGVPISVKGLGHKGSDQNCPILLNSAYEISEVETKDETSLKNKKQAFAQTQYFKKSVQASANSGFSFVETLGFSYIGKILKSGIFQKKPNLDISSMGLSEKDKENIQFDFEKIKIEEKVNLAFNALKNMGLTKNFAKFVFFIGHGSESSNNPYASALECGACAGHNGQSNAIFLATILNDLEVQAKLKSKGIEIPRDTLFMSGWHNTVKDELHIDKFEGLSLKQGQELSLYEKKFREASKNCQKERARNLPNCSKLKGSELSGELFQKANDWSEIRPEWGLARNASFVVGRRELTRSLELDGRAFLHDYDFEQDKDLSILELIMTAPMIVTNWINMQYYASTVNPQKFGAGNKVLNNVVGGIGCIQGNESDLLGGLTEQSVLYKGDYFHEPLRLQVFIEAETSAIDEIISKHQMVRELISNNWLKIISINPKNLKFKIFQSDSWIEPKEDLWN